MNGPKAQAEKTGKEMLERNVGIDDEHSRVAKASGGGQGGHQRKLALSNLPDFESRFLRNLVLRLSERRKAMKSFGKLSWVTKQPDEFEWLTLKFIPLVGNYCIFQFVEDNRVSVFVRSKARKNRGEILLAIEDLKIFDNAVDCVNAIELTIRSSELIKSGQAQKTIDNIRSTWAKLEVRLFDS